MLGMDRRGSTSEIEDLGTKNLRQFWSPTLSDQSIFVVPSPVMLSSLSVSPFFKCFHPSDNTSYFLSYHILPISSCFPSLPRNKSTATPVGLSSCASIAGWPSPPRPLKPLPATGSMIPRSTTKVEKVADDILMTWKVAHKGSHDSYHNGTLMQWEYLLAYDRLWHLEFEVDLEKRICLAALMPWNQKI